MGNQYTVTGLRDSGKGMDEVAERILAEWESLKAESADLDAIFGDGADDVGGLIRMLYEAVHSLAEESFTSAVEDFKAFGEALKRMGDNHEQTEQANAELLTKLMSELEGIKGRNA